MDSDHVGILIAILGWISFCFAVRMEAAERIDKANADITMLRSEIDKLRKHMEGK